MISYLRIMLAAGSLIAASALQSFAQTAPVENSVSQPSSFATEGWKFRVQLLGWLPELKATNEAGDKIKLSLSDVIDNLKMGVLGGFIAEKGKITLFSDIVYVYLKNTTNTTANIVGQPIDAKVKIALKTLTSTTGASYRVFENQNSKVSVLGGVRYLWMDAKADYKIGPVSGRVKDTSDYIDGIVGFHGQTDISDKWYVTYYADVGTGSSDRVYQALAGMNYRFKKFDLYMGYRYAHWDFDSGPLKDLTVHGPLIGAKWQF